MRSPQSTSFYGLLGVADDATTAEIRAAFLRLAQRHHPDLNAEDANADRRFKQIRRIYEVLNDPLLRAAYDEAPDRFRLVGADVVIGEHSPIVTRPVHGHKPCQPWASPVHGQADSRFRPRWLSDGRWGRELRVVWTAALSALIVLPGLQFTMLRAHRRTMENYRRSAAREPTWLLPSPTASRPDARHQEPSPLEKVIRSVGRLQADARATADVEGDAGPAKQESLDRIWDPRLGIELVDELNLPDLGMPTFALPPEVPPLAPLPPPGDALSPVPPAGYNPLPTVSPRDGGWNGPRQIDPIPYASVPLGELRAETLVGDEWPYDEAFESDWGRVAPAVDPPVPMRIAPPWSTVPVPSGPSVGAIPPTALTVPTMPTIATVPTISAVPTVPTAPTALTAPASAISTATAMQGASIIPSPVGAAATNPWAGLAPATSGWGSSLLNPSPTMLNQTAPRVPNLPSSATPLVAREFQALSAAAAARWETAAQTRYSTGQQSVPPGLPAYVSASSLDAPRPFPWQQTLSGSVVDAARPGLGPLVGPLKPPLGRLPSAPALPQLPRR